MFVQIPVVELVIVTETVHVAPAAIEAFAIEIVVAPATAVIVGVPQFSDDAAGTAATVTFGIGPSLNATPESGAAPTALFAIEIVMTDVPPGAIAFKLKALLIVTPGAGPSVLLPVDAVWFEKPPMFN